MKVQSIKNSSFIFTSLLLVMLISLSGCFKAGTLVGEVLSSKENQYDGEIILNSGSPFNQVYLTNPRMETYGYVLFSGACSNNNFNKFKVGFDGTTWITIASEVQPQSSIIPPGSAGTAINEVSPISHDSNLVFDTNCSDGKFSFWVYAHQVNQFLGDNGGNAAKIDKIYVQAEGEGKLSKPFIFRRYSKIGINFNPITIGATFDGLASATAYKHFQCIPVEIYLEDEEGAKHSVVNDLNFKIIQDSVAINALYTNNDCSLPAIKLSPFLFPAGANPIIRYWRAKNPSSTEIQSSLMAEVINSDAFASVPKSIYISGVQLLGNILISPATLDIGEGEMLFPQYLVNEQAGAAPYKFLELSSIVYSAANLTGLGSLTMNNTGFLHSENIFFGGYVSNNDINQKLILSDAAGTEQMFNVNYYDARFYLGISKLGGLVTNGATLTANVPMGSYFHDINGLLVKTSLISSPRVDYDPSKCGSDGKCELKGILIENAATNELRETTSFNTSNSKWNDVNLDRSTISLPNGPDGSSVKVLEVADNQTSLSSYISGYNGIIASGTDRYVASIYLKKRNSRYVALSLYDSGLNDNRLIVVDLVNGNIVATNNLDSTAAVNKDFGIQHLVKHDWYRVWFVTPVLNTGVNLDFRVYPAYTSGVTTFNEDSTATGKVYVWGPQLEVGSMPTSYIENANTLPIARNPDLLSLAPTGPTLTTSPADSGTLIVDFDIPEARQFSNRSLVSFNSTGELKAKIAHTNGIASSIDLHNEFMTTSAGYDDCHIQSVAKVKQSFAFSFGINTQLISSYDSELNQSNCIRNTASISTSAVFIGNNSSGNEGLNGHIKFIKFWKTKLSDAAVRSMSRKPWLVLPAN